MAATGPLVVALSVTRATGHYSTAREQKAAGAGKTRPFALTLEQAEAMR